MIIKKLSITKLNERTNVDIPIIDNRLVLVGENGQGKSTIVNILYCVLDCRWSELVRYNFEAVKMQIDDLQIELTKGEVLGYLDFEDDDRTQRTSRTRYHIYIKRAILEYGTDFFADQKNLKEYCDRIGIPLRMATEIIKEYSENNLSGVKRIPILEKNIKKHVTDKILFLPTYRRIEQDISYIFPRLVERMRGMPEYHRGELLEISNNVEMIKFGMEDVNKIIFEKMTQLKEEMRTRMNNLAVSFLRDAINENYKMVKTAPFFSIPDEQIADVLRRTSSDILSTSDKQKLQINILEAKKSNSKLKIGKTISLFFVSKLVDEISKQRENEVEIRKFVEICNKYLVGKIMSYDDVNFQITIRHNGKNEKLNEKEIEFKSLSSGEKQIVSLFCHIYLSNSKEYFIIIDEPELSLSVPWQKHFLPDIILGKCSGLISVTHSPFIFDNEFDKYAHSISEFSQEIA